MSDPGGVVRVLVVDDERVIADTLTLILCSRGLEAQAAYTAEAAIILARDFQPQALISDVIMPGLSGIDLAIHFAEHYPACKVLLVSGNYAASGLLEQSSQRSHIDAILTKPIHPAQIFEFLSTCVPVP
jgi:CheY-like chemotaxis protein